MGTHENTDTQENTGTHENMKTQAHMKHAHTWNMDTMEKNYPRKTFPFENTEWHLSGWDKGGKNKQK